MRINSNEIIEDQLIDRVKAIEAVLNADFVSYQGPIADQTPDVLKEVVESISSKRPRLAVMLETNGGYIESAERIANILRHHYAEVDFIVTSYAMSAGTVLVMSGDAIFMDYSAMLGPIDPQIARPEANDRMVPALGYLEHYKRLLEKSAAGTLTTAELAFMVEKFDPAELYQFEQARDLSIALLEQWLATYKFKNWRRTATHGRRVTAAMKRRRATQIAEALNDTQRWHSHARGISMEVLRRELNLLIDDIDATPSLAAVLGDYKSLLYDYNMRRSNFFFVASWAGGYHGH